MTNAIARTQTTQRQSGSNAKRRSRSDTGEMTRPPTDPTKPVASVPKGKKDRRALTSRKVQRLRLHGVAMPSKTAGFQDFLLDRKSLGVNVLAGIALLTALLVRVVFANASGPAWGNNVANLGSDIAIGYFAAWIVYYLTAWRPRRLDRNQALLTVGGAALQVTGQAQGMLGHLRQAAGDAGAGPIEQRELDKLVKHLNLDSAVPSMLAHFGGPQATVLEMITYWIDRTQSRIQDCMRVSFYLDAEMLAALLAIENCRLFTQVRVLTDVRVSGAATGLVPFLFDYLQRCDHLRGALCREYRHVLDGVEGLSMDAICKEHVASGALEWRPGAERPADWPPR